MVMRVLGGGLSVYVCIYKLINEYIYLYIYRYIQVYTYSVSNSSTIADIIYSFLGYRRYSISLSMPPMTSQAIVGEVLRKGICHHQKFDLWVRGAGRRWTTHIRQYIHLDACIYIHVYIHIYIYINICIFTFIFFDLYIYFYSYLLVHM